MGLMAELKRRNVFRVGIAYLVVAWLVMQVADVVINNIEAPHWLFQVIMLLLGIGLPVVLVFAWAFEMTPEGIKKEKNVDRNQSITPQTGKKLNNTILALMAIGIGYLLFDKFSGPADTGSESLSQQTSGQTAKHEEKTALPPAPEPSESTPTRQSIAVLPFDNRSRQEEDEFFVEGMHDDLLTNLARIGSLKVISRTSVTQYKDTEKTIPDIARELGVANIMEGAVQRSGNTVRINVQLIDAASDEHLWAEIYDRELTAQNLFAIQSEISKAIADALEATLSPEEQQRIDTQPTENLAAYDAYLRGRQLMARRRSNELEQAIVQFRRAVDLDPGFALAWIGLADSNSLLTGYGTLPEETAIPIMKEAVNKALAIDPNIGEAYATLGQIHEYDRRFDEVEIAYQKAIELNPNYATAYHWYANFLTGYSSRAEESLDLSRKALELDPRSSIIGAMLGGAYWNRGLFSLAEQQFLKVIELDPEFAQIHNGLARLYGFELGRFDKSVEFAQSAIELDPGNLNNFALLASTYISLGDTASAEATIRRMEELDANHWWTAFASVQVSLLRTNPAGTQEAINWALPKLRNQPQFAQFIGQTQLMIGDIAKARKIYLAANPGWMQADLWPGLIDLSPSDACVVSWILMRTGDQELGASLLQTTIEFYDNILPASIEHVDSLSPDICYMAAGDTEKAITAIETQVEHGHLFFMHRTHSLPMYDSIRDEPRYLVAMAERERTIAEQRENLARMDTETGP